MKYFLRRFAGELQLSSAASPNAVAWLQQQSWPGNVRQLANVIRQALLLDTVMLKSSGAAAAKSERTLATLIDEFLTSARQGTLSDAHAAVIETVERALFARAIELALFLGRSFGRRRFRRCLLLLVASGQQDGTYQGQ